MTTGRDEGHAWAEEAVRVARLYYHSGYTQEQVGQQLGLTRWKVNRLLAQAREKGIVRIEITPPWAMLDELEAELSQRYGVSCIVAPPVESGTALDEVGRAAAEYLAGLETPPGVLAVSWGKTMAAVAEHIRDGWTDGVRVVLANGALSQSYAPTGAAGIAERIAAAGRGTTEVLAGPAICEHAATRKLLESDGAIAQVLEPARQAPAAIFGLGALSYDSVLVQSGYLGMEEVDALRMRGAVGDVLGRFVDREGEIVDPDLDARTLGLTRDEIRVKELAIGVAAGREKCNVSAAALEGGWVNVFITDATNARAMLQLRTA